MTHAKRRFFGVLIALLAVVAIGGVRTELFYREMLVIPPSNSQGNILNAGFVVQQNDWLYYSNYDQGSYIYKQKLDGSQKMKVGSRALAYQINLVGDWIYYLNGAPGWIFRVNVNGKQERPLVLKSAENLIVTEGYMFFCQPSEREYGGLYRADLNGRNRKMLTETARLFVVEDGWIYYSNPEDKLKLYKMGIDGSGKSKLSDERIFEINIKSGYLYFSTWDDDFLYRMKCDGTEKTLLTTKDCRNINVAENYIYYTNASDEGRIYRMKLDGSENEVIVYATDRSSVNVTEDFIFYKKTNSIGEYFCANLDGSNIQRWEHKGEPEPALVPRQ